MPHLKVRIRTSTFDSLEKETLQTRGWDNGGGGVEASYLCVLWLFPAWRYSVLSAVCRPAAHVCVWRTKQKRTASHKSSNTASCCYVRIITFIRTETFDTLLQLNAINLNINQLHGQKRDNNLKKEWFDYCLSWIINAERTRQTGKRWASINKIIGRRDSKSRG